MTPHSTPEPNRPHDETASLPTDTAVLLNKIAELCLGSMGVVSPRKQAELDAIFRFVAENMKFRERLALATAVSNMGQVPATVFGVFLSDVYAVAQPIIENLDGIDDALLIGLANRNEESYLFSIAKRRIVSIPLTDIIVEKGQNPSVFTVARNQGARFSIQGFGRLVVRAQNEITLQNILSNRSDVPAEIAVQLKTLASSRAAKPAARIGEASSTVASSRSRQGWAVRESDPSSALDELRAKLAQARLTQ